MKPAVSLLCTGIASISLGATPPNFAGEYADKKFLSGQGVFQMSLEQTRNNVSVFFSAVYSDGHGAAPDADGTGTINSKGAVEFKWEDSFKNSGTGTIKRLGEDIVVSINPTRVAEPRCLQFYRNNMRLQRIKTAKSVMWEGPKRRDLLTGPRPSAEIFPPLPAVGR